MIRALFLLTATAAVAAPNAESLKFFEKDVRPLLVEACQECHGPQKHKGGLRLDNLPYILQGFDQEYFCTLCNCGAETGHIGLLTTLTCFISKLINCHTDLFTRRRGD